MNTPKKNLKKITNVPQQEVASSVFYDHEIYIYLFFIYFDIDWRGHLK